MSALLLLNSITISMEFTDYHKNALTMTNTLFNAILFEPEVYRAIAENEKDVFGL